MSSREEKFAIDDRELEELIFGAERGRRFTQDSPVMPDVWIAYGREPAEPLPLLLTPHSETTAAQLGHTLRTKLERSGSGTEHITAEVAHNESYVVATLDFDQLVKVVLPLTHWWKEHVWRPKTEVTDAQGLQDPSVKKLIAEKIGEAGGIAYGGKISPDLKWLMRIVGRIQLARKDPDRTEPPTNDELLDAASELVAAKDVAKPSSEPLLWRVDRNREAVVAIAKSILAVKADAAVRLFDLNCRDLRWAVIDSGIDATHPALRKRVQKGERQVLALEPWEPEPDSDQQGPVNNTRVVATYDFTRLRTLLDPHSTLDAAQRERLTDDEKKRLDAFRKALERGTAVDWHAIEPMIRIPHEEGAYRGPSEDGPSNEHGTHVAGILTSDWKLSDDRPEDPMPADHDLIGIASGLELYDLRVLRPDGTGDEFTLTAALQFVRHLNANKDRVLVHGINISMSIRHDVANFACGRTPVCEECERLIGTGTVVVAAAGNDGYARYQTMLGQPSEGYRSISITDPGNAEGVITVGATHRYRPHSYGVSYFSSRGPTGDGRLKPDIVAPGEKITAPVPNKEIKTMDGTSMAAPHVSAAAALLMARHQELIGQPARIKAVLCSTATDLGRERYFQGSGMVDVLRALQAV